MKTKYRAMAAVKPELGQSRQTALRAGSLAQQIAHLFQEEELVWDDLDGPSRALLANFLHKVIKLEMTVQGTH